MEKLNTTLQLVLKEEFNSEELKEQGLSKSLVHTGLGHSVFTVDEEIKERLSVFLEDFTEEKFYFRLSFAEDLSQKGSSSRSYMTHDGKFFKPKINGDILYFLGLNFVIIEVTRLGESCNFNIDHYNCKIKKITVNAENGEILEEILWDKTKFGRIESYLPNKLNCYSSAIYQCRRRLFNNNKK